ncbi:hypothetical protein [Psychroserpens luteus]|uniref:Lipid A biosynthesis acyltransferase n=1 Tax=Psychroserpens luteus TaxID=1434066 RepID=A0ABW5ZUA3_9FLAO|nr:hypothetical protein [Psychroserpens luteus]
MNGLTNGNTKINDWSSVDSKTRLQFLKVIANKRKLVTENSHLSDDDFYKKYLYDSINSQQSSEKYKEIRKNIVVKGIEKLKINEPSFYCSFHLGPLIILPFFLCEKKVNFLFIGSTEAYNKKDQYLNLAKNNNIDLTDENFGVGDTRAGMANILKKRKEGKSFFSYVDIGAGADNIKENKNKVLVKLNDVEIYARRGIPHLASHFQMPLVPIFTYFEGDKIIIEICEPIISNLSDKNQSAIYATQYLWEIFQPLFNKYPTQWETLHTIHQYYANHEQKIDKEKLVLDKNYTFNQKKYDFLIREENFYLFDIINVETIQLSEALYGFINKMYIKEIVLNGKELQYFIKNDNLRDSLIIKEVFI